MDDLLRQAFAIARSMWTRRWIGLATAGLVAVLGAGAVVFYPEKYQASAKVYVDTASVLRPLMKDLAFQPDLNEKVGMLAKTLLSRPNVERLLQTIGSKADGEGRSQDQQVDMLMRSIQVNLGGKSNLYEITYKDTDRQRAKDVVENLVNMFVNSGLGDNRRDSVDARRFLDEQIKTHEAKLTEAENRLRDFKLQHFGLTGTSSQDHFARIAQLSDAVANTRQDLSSAEQARDALRRELERENPQLPPEAMAQVPAAQQSEADARLEAMRRQLDDLSRRYTDDHPDVVALKRSIARTEDDRRREQRTQDASGKSKGTAATSPVYQRIRVELAQAEAKVAELRGRLSAEQSRLDQARATAGRVPEVEAQFTQLNRDYEVIRKNYEQLVAKRESAAMGERMEETSQDAAFRLIEPARVSQTPVFPNRTMVGVFAFLLALAAGVGVTMLLGQIVPTLYSIGALNQLSGRPVLGAVSMLATPAVQVRRRQERIRFALFLLGFIGLYIVWLTWLTMRTKS